MKHLTILVPEGDGNNLSSIVGAYKIFKRADDQWQKQGHKSIFSVELAGISKHVGFYDGLFSVNPHRHISDIKATNLIIIPSLNHNYHVAVARNRALVDWVRIQYKNGAEVASICTGAFLLASTGLLDGKKCSTHWSAKENFKALFPTVDVQTDALITDENGIYSNGGAYSFLNLIIYLVEKYYDRQTAVFCAKVFQIDINRQSQSEFIIFSNQKLHKDRDVKSAQLFIEGNIEKKISIDELCKRYSVTRRNFDRRFIKATGNSPLEYVQRVKIEAAKKSLENNRKSVNEVMYEVGYADPKSFRKVFRRITGISPLDYRKKYNKASLTN